jgi:hypothetical protein
VPEDQSAHPAPEHDSAGEADSRPVRCALGTGGNRVGAVAGPGGQIAVHLAVQLPYRLGRNRRRLPDPLAGWDLVGAVVT